MNTYKVLHIMGKLIPLGIKKKIGDVIDNPKIIPYYFHTLNNSRKNLLNLKANNNLKFTNTIAIQIHIFYTDLLPELYSYLLNICFSFDLYITTDSPSKKEIIDDFFIQHKLSTGNIFVLQVENRGRDIWPFLYQMHSVYNNYEYIMHLHTKKSMHTSLGEKWRKYLYKSLFGKKNHLEQVLICCEINKEIGFVSPRPFMKIIKSYYDNIHNESYNEMIDELLIKFQINISRTEIKEHKFPSGNMFIARTDAIRQLLEYPFSASDFPEEEGQINGTLQHIIEFFWIFIVTFNGYTYRECK